MDIFGTPEQFEGDSDPFTESDQDVVIEVSPEDLKNSREDKAGELIQGLLGPADPAIRSDLPNLDKIDELPDVPVEFDSAMDSKHEKKAAKGLTLRGLNEEITDFTQDQLAEQERIKDIAPSTQYFFDLEKVRIFGQYGATPDEMAAYFGVHADTIRKSLADEETPFHKVYNKANSMLALSLRQTQIKGALQGSERLLIHLGKHVLGQSDNPEPPKVDKDLARDKEKRKVRITTLTQKIEEFDD